MEGWKGHLGKVSFLKKKWIFFLRNECFWRRFVRVLLVLVCMWCLELQQPYCGPGAVGPMHLVKRWKEIKPLIVSLGCQIKYFRSVLVIKSFLFGPFWVEFSEKFFQPNISDWCYAITKFMWSSLQIINLSDKSAEVIIRGTIVEFLPKEQAGDVINTKWVLSTKGTNNSNKEEILWMIDMFIQNLIYKYNRKVEKVESCSPFHVIYADSDTFGVWNSILKKIDAIFSGKFWWYHLSSWIKMGLKITWTFFNSVSHYVCHLAYSCLSLGL